MKTPSICFHNGQNGGRGVNLLSHSPPLDVIKKNVSFFFFSFIPWYCHVPCQVGQGGWKARCTPSPSWDLRVGHPFLHPFSEPCICVANTHGHSHDSMVPALHIYIEWLKFQGPHLTMIQMVGSIYHHHHHCFHYRLNRVFKFHNEVFHTVQASNYLIHSLFPIVSCKGWIFKS